MMTGGIEGEIPMSPIEGILRALFDNFALTVVLALIVISWLIFFRSSRPADDTG